jgi:hypothetical protein
MYYGGVHHRGTNLWDLIRCVSLVGLGGERQRETDDNDKERGGGRDGPGGRNGTVGI